MIAVFTRTTANNGRLTRPQHSLSLDTKEGSLRQQKSTGETLSIKSILLYVFMYLGGEARFHFDVGYGYSRRTGEETVTLKSLGRNPIERMSHSGPRWTGCLSWTYYLL